MYMHFMFVAVSEQLYQYFSSSMYNNSNYCKTLYFNGHLI